MTQSAAPGPIAAPLLAWFRHNRRPLPFREDPSPYHIWLSEIMLQQTRVSAALPYYQRFIAELPTIAHLAACPEERLHKLWQGLGYYSRARNLQKAARIVVAEYGGELPASYEALLALPGIGEYTAGAIASIAFGLPEVAVDGNVLRVFSRLLDDHRDIGLPQTKTALAAEVRRQQPPEAPGDFNEALMELGALVCTPKSPACAACPLAALCRGRAAGSAAALPVKAPKKPKTECPVCVLLAHTPEGRVLLHRRPARGLLAGLWEPLTIEGRCTRAEAQAKAEALLPGARLLGALPEASHVFTHRVWRLYGWHCLLPAETAPPPGYALATAAEALGEYAIPNAFAAYRPLMGRPPPADGFEVSND